VPLLLIRPIISPAIILIPKYKKYQKEPIIATHIYKCKTILPTKNTKQTKMRKNTQKTKSTSSTKNNSNDQQYPQYTKNAKYASTPNKYGNTKTQNTK